MEAVGCLAAHAHITTADLLSRMYGESARHLISPKVFIDCLTMAQNMAVKIKQEVVVSIDYFYIGGLIVPVIKLHYDHVD